MRAFLIFGGLLLLSGCVTIPIGPDETPRSPSELDRLADNGCRETPNTGEWLECRRRVKEEWQPSYDNPKPILLPGG